MRLLKNGMLAVLTTDEWVKVRKLLESNGFMWTRHPDGGRALKAPETGVLAPPDHVWVGEEVDWGVFCLTPEVARLVERLGGPKLESLPSEQRVGTSTDDEVGT